MSMWTRIARQRGSLGVRETHAAIVPFGMLIRTTTCIGAGESTSEALVFIEGKQVDLKNWIHERAGGDE